MGKLESNAEIIEPKYYIRYFVYEDFTRQRVRYRSAYWGDDKVIESLQFGASFEMKEFHPIETEI